MTKFFDTHAHYFDKKYLDFALTDSAPTGADALLDSGLMQDTISGIINVGTDPETSKIAIEQAQSRPFMCAAVGIHPEDAQIKKIQPDEGLSAIEAMVCDTEERQRNKIVAIGEIGYDYYWTPIDKPLQKAFFEGQLALAEKYSLPVIIHDREAHGDSLAAVQKFKNVVGVFHAYSGSAETAKELARRGWYFGLGGAVTFKNAERLRSVVATLPLDRILLETDCPYMSPAPHRGKINHSALLPHVAAILADIYKSSVDEIAEITRENTRKLFGI